MTPLEALRDALTRVVAIVEALEVGDYRYAAALAQDLESDLVAVLAAREGAR